MIHRLACLSVLLLACGGGGEDAPDAGGPPVLLSHVPASDSANVWPLDPIVLELSAPIDPATANASTIVLTSGGEPVAATFAVQDGRVTITPTDPPPAPADLEISVGTGLAGLDGQALQAPVSWSWHTPIWSLPGLEAGGVAGFQPASLAVDDSGRTLLVSHALRVVRYEDGAWQDLGGTVDANASAPGIIVQDGTPFIAWVSGNALKVSQWNGSAWEAMPGLDSEPVRMARIAPSPTGAVVAWLRDSGQVRVSRWTGSTWAAVGQPYDGTGVLTMVLAMDGTVPVIAVSTASELTVLRWSGAQWDPLGDAVSVAVPRPALAVMGGTPYLAWEEPGESSASDAYLARYDGNQWVRYPALDLRIESSATSVALSDDGVGRLLVAWSEEPPSGSPYRVYVARLEASGLQVLAHSPSPVSSAALEPLLTADAAARPIVAWWDVIQNAAFAGRTTLIGAMPFGLSERPTGTTCVIPADGDPSFPQTLTATGCFTNVPYRVPAPELIPFDLNSPLWSDGAHKQRYMVIPAGETIGFTATGAWKMPIGTIMVKEFLGGDEPNVTPMETRFLVKRCEETDLVCPTTPWQGYSYQWDAAGSDAVLLDGTATVTQTWQTVIGGAAATQTHVYPGRADCVRCHTVAAGGVLGPQTGQLNRARDYGAHVDNQLRALQHIGLFGSSMPAAVVPARIATPHDRSFTLEQRTRAYLHSNCSHCHRPGGEMPGTDFRYETVLGSTGLCGRVTPGDAEGSSLYIKDYARAPDVPSVGGQPMPPLATLMRDDRQLAITKAWIDSLATCP